MVEGAREALQQALHHAPRCLALLQAELKLELRSDQEVVDLTLDSDSDFKPPRQPAVCAKRRRLSAERGEPAAAAASAAAAAPGTPAHSGGTQAASELGQESEGEEDDGVEEEDEKDENQDEEGQGEEEWERDEEGEQEAGQQAGAAAEAAEEGEQEQEDSGILLLPNHVPYPLYLEEVQRAEMLGTDPHGIKAFSGHCLLQCQRKVLQCGLPVVPKSVKDK